VRIVNHEAGTVAPTGLDDAGEVRDIAAHTVDAVDDNQGGFVVGDALEDGFEVARFVMAEADRLAVRQSGAVVDARVIALSTTATERLSIRAEMLPRLAW
jgi:hypothetical protein